MLHLGNAGQLGFQPLLLLGEGEARRRVQLLEAPASLPVELQQVGVVLPVGGGDRKLHTHKKLSYSATCLIKVINYILDPYLREQAVFCRMCLTTGRVCG